MLQTAYVVSHALTLIKIAMAQAIPTFLVPTIETLTQCEYSSHDPTLVIKAFFVVVIIGILSVYRRYII